MDKTNVRIESVFIQGFKNVMKGGIDLKNQRVPFCASILGLYGQNGSGKTVLIDAIELLRLALCGKRVPVKFADFINVDASCARLEYRFEIKGTDEVYHVVYGFSMEKATAPSTNTELEEYGDGECQVLLSNETLSYSFESSSMKFRMGRLIDTDTNEVFVPLAKYDCLIGADDKAKTDLMAAKKMASADSRSFVFSRELLQEIRRKNKDASEMQRRHLFVMERLVAFGNFELFVINTRNSGLISLDALPLTFTYGGKGAGVPGSLMVPLDGVSAYAEETLGVIRKIIRSMNVVLPQIIPGLTISIRELGMVVLKNKGLGTQIQLVSCRSGQEIPLRYESEGIRKIVSVLHLLVGVYNHPSLTVAIDELDAGIFEYLLGEILRVVSEKGKGQLIFTSHNLRPLETLNHGYIAFTTTNPYNRYIRMTNVKGHNNLRDLYFRDIMLGEQSESVYDITNNYEIALAFKEAGDLYGA